MTRRVASPFREVPASAASTLFGALGGAAAVPFYYNRLYNLNRDNSNNFVQWADAIRGYTGPGAPPVITPIAGTTLGTLTYDATKGLVCNGSSPGTQGASAALSISFSLSAGPAGGPATTQAINTIWLVGQINAGQSFSNLLVIQNGASTQYLYLQAAGSGARQYVTGSSYGSANMFDAVSTINIGATRILIIATCQVGQQHGIQIPNQALVQNTDNQARPYEPYSLQLFYAPGSTGNLSCGSSIAEIGALTRTANASDITLLKNNAVAVHSATLQ